VVIRDEEQEARFLVERGARVAINGKFYELVGDKIDRRRINDWPDPIPSSGKRDLDTRALQQALHIRDIRNDFAGEHVSVGGDVATHFEHGHIHDLADAQADTRFGSMYPPRNENNPNIGPGAVTVDGVATHDVAGDGVGGHNYNPRASVYFNGSSNSGVFTWYEDDDDVRIIFWNGTSWAVAATLDDVDGSDSNHWTARDIIVHKELLYVLVSKISGATGDTVLTSSDGETFVSSVASNAGTAGAQRAGSRLLSDGDTIYAFNQQTDKTIDIYSSTNKGAAWTTLGEPVLNGQLRDVGLFFDRNGNNVITILTEDSLYWLDTANSVAVQLLPMPFGGRAMAQVGSSLLIIMDGFHALLYAENGGITDVSPILPTPYDFDTDAGSHACIFNSLNGPIVMFSGDTRASGDAVLIAQFIVKAHGVGFHYIWHEATNVQGGHAGKFIHVDPASGDLLGAINSTSGDNDLSTGLQFKDIEEDPSLMATLDVRTTGHIRSQRMNMGSSEVTKTFLTTGIESQKVDSTETITPEYRIDGATSAFGGSASALPAIILENARVSFPGPSSSSTEGVSAVNLQIQYAFASGGVTLGAFIDEFVLTYLPIPTKRYVYTFTVRILEGQSDQEPAGTLADLDTLEDTKIKVDFIYGGRSAVEVLPISQTRMLETIVDTDNEVTARREAEVTLVLAEI
jgi:hypothetical protein